MPQSAPDPSPAVAIQGGRAAWGAVLLLAPRIVLRRCHPVPPRLKLGARALGLRHVIQAIWVLRAGSVEARRRGVLVDAAHLSSMVGLALVSRRYRCGATISLRADSILAGLSAATQR